MSPASIRHRRRSPSAVGGAATLLVFLAVPQVAAGEEPPDPEQETSFRERIEELEERIARFEARAESEDATARQGVAPADVAPPGERDGPEDVRVRPFWSREALETPGPFRGVYDKPFLATLWRRAHVGGYTEFEYHSFEDGVQGIPEGFRMHRTNLFLFTEMSDRVRFGSELEFETEFEGAANSSDIEVAVEMAFVDWTLWQEVVLRGGALLAPLGRINVNHDGPVRELTERPLVSTFVIPTTLTEAGVGAHGTFHLDERFALSYEAYAVNGFRVLDGDGELAVDPVDRVRVLREARTSLGGDANDAPASTGRLAVEWADHLEAGGSWHAGTYDERGDNLLGIFAGDLAAVWGPVAVEGEVAVADFGRDAFAETAGVPDVFWGYWIQTSVGGMPDALSSSVPWAFGGDGARLGAVLRWEWIDLDGDRGEVIEPGITFRPVADTVIKFSWRLAPSSFGLRGVPGRETFDDEGFVASLSSYF